MRRLPHWSVTRVQYEPYARRQPSLTRAVHATLALAAATALAGIGRIEADAWREVAGTKVCGLAAGSGWLVLAYGGRPARNCEAAGELMTVGSLSPWGRSGPSSPAGTG